MNENIKKEGMSYAWQKFKRDFRLLISRRIVLVALIVVVVFILAAVFAPFITRYDPVKNDMSASLQGPSAEHWLGTDLQGRDVFTRLVYGTRASLIVGVCTVVISGILGSILGLVSGYFGGFVDDVISRFCEVFMSIPQVILALAIGSILGGGLLNLTIILGITNIPGYFRLMRAQVLSVKETDYVLSAKVSGATNMRLMMKHILPNTVSILIVLMTQTVGVTILAEAGLSFLGLGVNPPTPSWGSMINESRSFLLQQPVFALAPGVAIVLLVLSLNIVGDGVRDLIDPRMRNLY